MSDKVVGKGAWWCAALLGMLLSAVPLSAQGLANYDYENLSLRGLGVEWGYLYPSRVEPTQSVGVRLDLGYLGPGLRIVPGFTYWSSRYKAAEVSRLERRVESLIQAQTDGPSPTVDLGEIDWSDIATTLDADVVWRIPFGLFSNVGLGVSAHILNGSGDAVNGTFVEDLLDSVAAGFNLHGGLEYPLRDRLRLYGSGRYEVMGDLQYLQLRFGTQIMFGPTTEGGQTR